MHAWHLNIYVQICLTYMHVRVHGNISTYCICRHARARAINKS
uniref:Uncharacterized protein n=1 Tax=Rhizophora mucronata TaxID=61149 RepID=A0A2P2QKJ4_RHIMU